MPVHINIPPAKRERYIKTIQRPEVRPTDESAVAGRKVRIGLMNNMPDGALEASERQFFALLSNASNGVPVELSFYSLPGIPRGRDAEARIGEYYSSAEMLCDSGLDALIVTGREPLAPRLSEEPYWEGFTRVIDWARNHTIATVWSCLAAHAAVLYQDDIQRVKSDRKHCGIFPCSRVGDHPLTRNLPSQITVPHSRWNGLGGKKLSDCGYQILTQSSEAGVDTFVKQYKSLFVYFQGHPEYESSTLLLEYRRDVGRFLRGEMDHYPTLPKNYFSPEVELELRELQSRAAARPDPEIAGELTAILDHTHIGKTWHATANQIYRNLLHFISAQKTHSIPLRGSTFPETEVRTKMQNCFATADYGAILEQ